MEKTIQTLILSAACLFLTQPVILDAMKKQDTEKLFDIIETNMYNMNEDQKIKELKKVLKTVDINSQNKNGLTALHEAASGKYTKIVQFLIENGANIESKAWGDSTALFLAAENGALDTVTLLFTHNADINTKNKYGTALHRAIIFLNKLIDSSKQSFDYDYIPGPQYHKQFQNAVDCVNFIIKNGANENIKDSEDRTALHLATDYGFVQIVESLLKKGANPNIKNKDGDTALHIAAKRGDVDCLKPLIAHGATIDTRAITLAKNSNVKKYLTSEQIRQNLFNTLTNKKLVDVKIK